MLVFGHRGVRKTSPENTIEAIRDAIKQGAHGVEIDIQLTQDGVPVVIHDHTLMRTHKINRNINKMSFNELKQVTAHQPVSSLTEVLDLFWKQIYFNIEVKSKDTGRAVVGILATNYIKSDEDWKFCFISSFKIRELWQARDSSDKVQLALIHNRVPFTFFWYHRKIKFAAVGFHKQYTQIIATTVARRLGIMTYVYTINRIKAVKIAKNQGFDMVITDQPAKIISAIDDIQKAKDISSAKKIR